MRRVLLMSALLLAGCAGPARFAPVAWEVPPAPEPIATTKGGLAPAQLVAKGQLRMPEDCVADAQGRLYAGTADGRIVQIDQGVVGTYATTGGTPLGLKFDGQGRLLACVVGRGLVAIAPDGTPTTLATGIGGRPFRFINDVDVAPDGTIWFTESHTGFGPEGAEAIWALAESGADGRLFSLDPRTGVVQERLEGLHFANGCTALPDGSAVLVAETTRYRIRRLWLTGPKAGQDDVFVATPGFPDGIMADAKGRVWAALVPHDPLIDNLAPHPWARALLMKLPAGVLTGMAADDTLGWIVAYGSDGTPLLSWQDDSGRFSGGIANVMPANGRLCFGTKWGDWVATMALPE